MRRYGLAFLGVAIALLLGCIYLLTQRISDAEEGLLLEQQFRDHEYAVYTADIDEKEDLVASGGADGLRVWRVDNAKEVFHRPGTIHRARFVKGDSLLCADSREGVLLLDCQTWRVRRKLAEKADRIIAEVSFEGDKIAATFSSSAKKVARESSLSTEIHVWQFENDEWQESTLRGHKGPVFGLEFLPGSPHLISRGEDGIMRVWDLASGKQIDKRGEDLGSKGHRIPEAMTSCALNRLLAVRFACDYAMGVETLLRSATKNVADDKNRSPARTAMFSPDTKWVATGHEDGTFRLWDEKTLVEKAVAKGSINGSSLNEVRFSRSGKLVVTAGDGTLGIMFEAMKRKVKADDTVVRVWRVNIPE
jgi:WD40 repeat protein